LKFKLKQEKFQELLEKLIVKDIFPSSTICVDNDSKTGKPVLFSIQKETHGRAVRYLKVNSNFFEEIEEGKDAIEIDVDRTLSIVKLIRPNTLLTIETVDNKLKISGVYEEKDDKGNVTSSRKIAPHITFKTPEEKDIKKKLPFAVEGKTPVVGEGDIPLDVQFEMELDDLKDLPEVASSVKTEYYSFRMKDGKLNLRIGDLHNFSDFWDYEPRIKTKMGNTLEMILTFGLSEVASTCRSNPTINAHSYAPIWLYEKTDDYLFGILIPTYNPREGEEVN